MALVVEGVHRLRLSYLSQVAQAPDSIGSFASGVKRGDENGNEQSDNADNDEEFDKSKSVSFLCRMFDRPSPERERGSIVSCWNSILAG